MLGQGWDKKSLFAATMLAGVAAAMVTGAPAWAQAAPATRAPAVQQPVQPAVQAPRIDEDAGEGDTQTNADGTEAQDDELAGVVVTGSRIRRPEYEGNIPGVQVDSEEIERRNFVNAVEILNDIPLVGPGPALSTAGGQTASLGVSFVDLLDLGTQRTLTLLNGRRLVSGNSATLFVSGNTVGGQVDVNMIPSALIDRVDVLTVGGAAAYGSDAIAGVVNFILKTDYEGAEVSAIYGQSSEGDSENYSLRGLVGRNFMDGRGNAALSYEYNYIAALYSDERDFLADNPATVTNFLNGGVRNAGFDPLQRTTGGNTAFLPAGSDFIPGTLYLRESSSIISTDGGTVLQLTPGNASNPTTAVNQIGPVNATALFTNNVQLIPGVAGVIPLGTGIASGNTTCNPSGATGNPICTFAPTSLPTGVTAAQVFTAFRVTPPAGLTPAEQTALAVNILQQNRPTPREFFAANPNTPINAFLGSFVAPLPDIANPDPATNRFLPRLAVPLVFNAQGNVEEITVATLTPTTPASLGAAPGGSVPPGANTQRFANIRIEQERHIGTFIGNFDITPNINFFTENLVAEIKTTSPRNTLSGNAASSSTTENAALIVNVNNPFLDDADRAALARVGISSTVNAGKFVLSRTNQDLVGDNPSYAETSTVRSANGVRGDFSAFGRQFDWEASYVWGRVEQRNDDMSVADLEYALAVDVVRAPNGEIVCRSKLTPSIIGTTPPGVGAVQVVEPGPDGIPTVRTFNRTVTQADVDACVPLNPFGIGQMSEAAKAYATTPSAIFNTNELRVAQAFISGELFDLPAGALGFSIAGELRKENLYFTQDPVTQRGGTRSAPSATTQAETRAWEAGAEFLVPIFGGDFQIPGFYSLDISPAVRFSKQEGEGVPFRNVAGQVISPTSEGDLARIYTLAFTWRPIQDVTFRGNKSRSIRQPYAVELFLGVQPSFFTPTDPCSNNQIGSGARPDVRRRNCIADVIRLGFAANEAAAETFLNGYVASGVSRQGASAGTPDLEPEIADSYTLGVSVSPRFIPRFRASVDYVDVNLKNQITRANLNTNLQLCYDSPTFPDSSAQVGANTCLNFSRRGNGDFNVGDGYTSGWFNLAATVVRGYNIRADYGFDIADGLTYLGFPTQADLGDLRFRFNAYNLEDFITSAAGDFSDASISTGSITAARPEWETQLSTIYTRGPFDVGLTWDWNSGQSLFTSGQRSTIENFPFLNFPGYHLFNATLGYDFMDRYRASFTVNNLLGTIFYPGRGGELANPTIGTISNFGRTYRVSLRATF